MMGINQLITKQKICKPLSGNPLNQKTIDFVCNEQIGSREIFEKRLQLGKFITQSIYRAELGIEVKKLRDHRFPVRRDKLCVCAKMEHRSRSLIAIKRRIVCETFIFVKRVIFAYLFVCVQTVRSVESAVACGGIDIRV